MIDKFPSLQSHLWEAANILRGSAVDRTDWKGYILPLLFFKRISNVWDEEHARMIEQYGENHARSDLTQSNSEFRSRCNKRYRAREVSPLCYSVRELPIHAHVLS